MEKWKIAVIVILLASVAGYGYYQSIPAGSAIGSTANGAAGGAAAGTNDTPLVAAPPAAPGAAAGTSPNGVNPYLGLVGQQPPAWDIPADRWANTSQPVKLDDLKGNVTLIEFWRASCSHCQEAAPFMEQIYKNFSKRGMKMVTFHTPARNAGPDSVEGNWSKVQDTMKEWGITYPVAYDQGSVTFEKFGLQKFPTAIVLDRKGIVRYMETGFDQQKANALTGTLQMLLMENPAGIQPPAS